VPPGGCGQHEQPPRQEAMQHTSQNAVVATAAVVLMVAHAVTAETTVRWVDHPLVLSSVSASTRTSFEAGLSKYDSCMQRALVGRGSHGGSTPNVTQCKWVCWTHLTTHRSPAPDPLQYHPPPGAQLNPSNPTPALTGADLSLTAHWFTLHHPPSYRRGNWPLHTATSVAY
jgi:hypothetical protein